MRFSCILRQSCFSELLFPVFGAGTTGEQEFCGRMNNILLAAGSDKTLDLLRKMLGEVLEEVNIISVSGGSDARLSLKENDIDLVVVNTPMKDEQGIEFAVYAAESEKNPVILVTNPESYSRVGQKLEEHGVVAMKRPVERKIFSCALRDAMVFGRVFNRLKSENRELKESIEETKLVNRAKGMLMSHLNMTESQAHRYIEKQAMDLVLTRPQVALNILKTYES